MAQTRKRRRTKHRGNAAGMVEARGRTGRPPSAGEKQAKGARPDAAQRRRNRLEQPPTWRSAFNRAGIATIVFAILVILVFGQSPAQAIVLAVFVLLLYVPLTYYTDLWIHRRYMRKQAAKERSAA